MKNLKRRKLGECFVDSLQKGKASRDKKLSFAIAWAWILLVAVIVTFLVIGLIVDKKVGQYQTKEKAPRFRAVLLKQMASITAYSEIDSCHTGESCLMANGIKAEKGFIACPRSIELGTEVFIPDLIPNSFICGDRTAMRLDGRYDIFKGYGSEALQQAKDFGLQRHDVYIVIKIN